MAWARSRRRKTGTYHYVFHQGRTFAAGKGKEGRELAQTWAAAMTKARRAKKAGMPLDEAPGGPCLWTLTTLYHADMTEARRRGLRTVQPQFQGKISKRESDWRQLLAFFGAETNLDAISGERIRAFIEWREAGGVGPSAINRGLFGILRPALRLAREREESGYTRDPFLGIRTRGERAVARKPIALPEREVWKVIRRCWKKSRKLGAYVELLFQTASRLNERPEVGITYLLYPPYKRGRARPFELTPRLAVLAALPRAFDRKLWTAAVIAAGHPDLRPHDLRHTAITLAAKRPGASLDSIQKLGGWQSAVMANVYLHGDGRAIEPLGGPPVARKKRRSTGNNRLSA